MSQSVRCVESVWPIKGEIRCITGIINTVRVGQVVIVEIQKLCGISLQRQINCQRVKSDGTGRVTDWN